MPVELQTTVQHGPKQTGLYSLRFLMAGGLKFQIKKDE